MTFPNKTGLRTGASRFAKSEITADLEHLTVRLKRAWAYAGDKRASLGVHIDALHAAARRRLDDLRDADGSYFVVKECIGGPTA